MKSCTVDSISVVTGLLVKCSEVERSVAVVGDSVVAGEGDLVVKDSVAEDSVVGGSVVVLEGSVVVLEVEGSVVGDTVV